jgi:hypothetical protein
LGPQLGSTEQGVQHEAAKQRRKIQQTARILSTLARNGPAKVWQRRSRAADRDFKQALTATRAKVFLCSYVAIARYAIVWRKYFRVRSQLTVTIGNRCLKQAAFPIVFTRVRKKTVIGKIAAAR